MLEGGLIPGPLFRNLFPLTFHEVGDFGKEVVGYCFRDGLLIIAPRIETEYNCDGMGNYRSDEDLNFHLRRRKIASY